MLNKIEKFIDFLNHNGIEFTKLTPPEIEAYKQEWFNNFVPMEKQEKAINSFCFDKDGFCGYLWHVFSYEILSCLKKSKAKNTFNELDKQGAVLLVNIDEVAYRVKDVCKIKAQDLDFLDDIILTAQDFSWTYAKTHEATCGPYFYLNYLSKKMGYCKITIKSNFAQPIFSTELIQLNSYLASS